MRALEYLMRARRAWLLPGEPLAQLDFADRRAWLADKPYVMEASFKGLFSSFSTPAHWATDRTGRLRLIPANSIDCYWMPEGLSWGQLIEEARTPLAVYSRTLDPLAWTLTNMSRSAAIGADGTTGAAIKLTAGATNATALANTNTSASAARDFAPYVRRITGTGNIDVTFDGGSTWSTLAGITSSYSRVEKTATVANPRVGFRIGTSGDEILVDFANGETGSFATSPIETTSGLTTRGASTIVANDGTPLATAFQNAKSIFARSFGVVGGTGPRLLDFATSNSALHFLNSGQARAFVVSSAVDATLGSGSWSGLVNVAYGMDGASFTAKANGGAVASLASAWSAGGNVSFGNRAAADRALNGYLGNLTAAAAKGIFDNLAAA